MRLESIPANSPAPLVTGPAGPDVGAGNPAMSFQAMVSQASEDIAMGDAAKGLEPAVADPSSAKPASPLPGSPLFVAGGALTTDMVQMLNQGWSPAILVPSEPYSADAPDYKPGFGVDGTLSGYQQRLSDAGIMRQSGPGQTMSVNSSGPGATMYPVVTQAPAAPASATSMPTPGHAASDAIPPAVVSDPRPSIPTSAPAPEAAAPAPEAVPATKAVVRMSGEAPVAAPISPPAPALPPESASGSALMDEMLRELGTGRHRIPR